MTTPRPPREPVSEVRIVEAAMRIADAQGLAAVTMRAVASALGVQAMSLYNHVANKDAILDRLVDAVFADLDIRTDLPWKASMRARAVSLHEATLRHPWAIGLLESRRTPGAATLRHHDAWIGVLRRAGLPADFVAHALAVTDAFVYGFALQQVTMAVPADEGIAALAEEILASMPADSLPDLGWFTAEHVLKPGYAFAHEFDFGLDLILDGLEAAAHTLPGGNHA